MAETWLDNLPGIKDVIDGTGATEVTLARGHKLVIKGRATVAADSASKRVTLTIGTEDDLIALSDIAPSNVTRAAASAGADGEAARRDHKHDVATATAITITDSTNSEGSSPSLARADHGHSHGTRGGGTLHAAATTSVAGFMSAADKTLVDSLGSFATAIEITDSTNGAGSTGMARANHVHAHGVRGGGTLHANATGSVAGFMSATDKTKLDTYPTTAVSVARRVSIVGVTALVNGSAGTSATPDFSSMSLQTGDALFVFGVNDIAGALQNPASQGWAVQSSDAWATGARTATVYTKVWGQGPADDTTPTFTFPAGDYAAFGFAVRGLQLSAGNVAATATAVSTPADALEFNAPETAVTVSGSLALTFAAHNFAGGDDWDVLVQTAGAASGSALPLQRIATYEANNTTLDYEIAAFARIVDLAGLGTGTIRIGTTADPTLFWMRTMTFAPIQAA